MSETCTPELYLRTCYVLNEDRRSIATREPSGTRPPVFTLVRGRASCAWAVRADVPANVASEIDRVAQDEPVAIDFRDAPLHAQRYLHVLGHLAGSVRSMTESDGPAFRFPELLAASDDVAPFTARRFCSATFAAGCRARSSPAGGPLWRFSKTIGQ
jgi:hypothetical protein